MIFKEIKRHPVDYSLLIGGLLILLVFFLSFFHQPQIQIKIVLIGVVYYLLWGVFHHWRRGDFCLKILLEYLLIGALAAAAAFLVLGGV